MCPATWNTQATAKTKGKRLPAPYGEVSTCIYAKSLCYCSWIQTEVNPLLVFDKVRQNSSHAISLGRVPISKVMTLFARTAYVRQQESTHEAVESRCSYRPSCFKWTPMRATMQESQQLTGQAGARCSGKDRSLSRALQPAKMDSWQLRASVDMT